MADETITPDATEADGAEQAQPEAAEQQQGAEVKADTTSEEATEASDTGRSENNESEDDLADWARKKGLPLSEEPTENELKLAKMQREADRKISQTSQRSSELEDAYRGQIDNIVSDNPDVSADTARLAKIELDVAVEKFFRANPDASALEGDMAKLVTENPARANLPLEDLYQLAKSRSTSEADMQKEGGRKALEGLAAKQKAASPRAAATSTVDTSTGITQQDVQNALANHDLDWLRRHAKEIDAL